MIQNDKDYFKMLDVYQRILSVLKRMDDEFLAEGGLALLIHHEVTELAKLIKAELDAHKEKQEEAK